jgi:hypothetical protein
MCFIVGIALAVVALLICFLPYMVGKIRDFVDRPKGKDPESDEDDQGALLGDPGGRAPVKPFIIYRHCCK